MSRWKNMFGHGCYLVMCDNEREKTAYARDCLREHPECRFEIRSEFKGEQKKLFSNPCALDVLMKNKTIKTEKRKTDVIRLLTQMQLDDLMNRSTCALSYSQKFSFSVAYDVLEKNKNMFLLMEDPFYDPQMIKTLLKYTIGYAKRNQLTFVWITDTAHRDEELQKMCDGLFTLENGMLKPYQRKETDSSAKTSTVTENPYVAPKCETPKVVEESGPKVIATGDLPCPGKVCRLGDGTEVIVLDQCSLQIKKMGRFCFLRERPSIRRSRLFICKVGSREKVY